MKPYLIVNPCAGSGRTGRRFDRIARAVRAAVGDFECAFTRAPGDGARLAREAARSGGPLVVAVGGDGTASEVVDGLAAEGGASEPIFGFIPQGTGSDLRRTLGIPLDLDEAAAWLAGREERRCDVGRIEYAGHGGAPEVRHFANVAGFGVSGVVDREVNEGFRMLPHGRLAFMLASAKALVGWKDQPVRWRADGGPWTEGAVTALSVCNGRFFGGGMQVAPGARLDDGVFDVVIWSGLGLTDFVTKKRMLYDGRHLSLPNTRLLRATSLEAEAREGARVLLDVDGEQPGMLPARFTIRPGALRVRVRGRG